MAEVEFPYGFSPIEAASYGKSIVAKFTLPIATIDSHSIASLIGISSAGDTCNQNVGNLIDWLIDLEYLVPTPTGYRRRQFLRLHDRWSGDGVAATEAFKNQFRGPLAGAVLVRNKHYG